jgi:hypothetical protein
MKKFNLLSRAEMKKVMGGVFEPESIDGEFGTKCYACCPNGDAKSSMCSDKVTVKTGEKATCSMGTVTNVPC